MGMDAWLPRCALRESEGGQICTYKHETGGKGVVRIS